MMDKDWKYQIRELIEKVTDKKYNSIPEVIEQVKRIEKSLKYALGKMMSTLKRSDVGNNSMRSDLATPANLLLEESRDRFPKRIMDSLTELAKYWTPEIKWEINTVYETENKGECLLIKPLYQLKINSSIEDIEGEMNRYIKQCTDAILLGSLITTSDREILRDVYECYYLSKNELLKDSLKNTLEENFDIELKECVPNDQFANEEYFDTSTEFGIETPVTTRLVVISKKDNSCIIKGHYVIPKQKVYE